ncbi:MAG TPA: hypothetical protein VK582_17800 [Pyrinomonadaceae bacterium]|nr:hypothetical protein [Pyrinomonadaceae bacterium]
MAEEVRIWRIQNGNQLREIHTSKLDFEERLEHWMDEDISVLSNDLLVIGRQTETAFGGCLDLLCLNQNGDVVIVELKRDRTPREVTAQVLDYASWVKDLSREMITNIADKYLDSKPKGLTFEKAFRAKFDLDLPEVLNESHSMLIVGSEIDASSERIVKYLSDEYGVNINVATFQYLKAENNDELLARIFLIEPSQVEYKTQTKGDSKRKRDLTHEELRDIATQNGVNHLYQRLVTELEKRFIVRGRTRSSLPFRGHVNGGLHTIISLLPPASNPANGLRFEIYIQRLANYAGLQTEKAVELLPANREEWVLGETYSEDYSGYDGFFSNIEEVDRFLAGLQHVLKH